MTSEQKQTDRRQGERRHFPRPGGRRATDTPQDWVSVSDYARIYGVDRGTVYKWLEMPGVLDTYTVGTLRRIRNLPPKEKQPSSVEGC